MVTSINSSLIALYAGPDQVMTVTSGLASVVGMVLIFWHKLVAAFSKLMNRLRGLPEAPVPAPGLPQKDTPPQGS